MWRGIFIHWRLMHAGCRNAVWLYLHLRGCSCTPKQSIRANGETARIWCSNHNFQLQSQISGNQHTQVVSSVRLSTAACITTSVPFSPRACAPRLTQTGKQRHCEGEKRVTGTHFHQKIFATLVVQNVGTHKVRFESTAHRGAEQRDY